MSNRTDWKQLAQELIRMMPWTPDAFAVNIEKELHNAFVAGQENSDSTTLTAELSQTRQALGNMTATIECVRADKDVIHQWGQVMKKERDAARAELENVKRAEDVKRVQVAIGCEITGDKLEAMIERKVQEAMLRYLPPIPITTADRLIRDTRSHALKDAAEYLRNYNWEDWAKHAAQNGGWIHPPIMLNTLASKIEALP